MKIARLKIASHFRGWQWERAAVAAMSPFGSLSWLPARSEDLVAKARIFLAGGKGGDAAVAFIKNQLLALTGEQSDLEVREKSLTFVTPTSGTRIAMKTSEVEVDFTGKRGDGGTVHRASVIIQEARFYRVFFQATLTDGRVVRPTFSEIGGPDVLGTLICREGTITLG